MPDPPDPPKLPELQQGVLDPPKVQQLFTELVECTEILQVTPKYADQQYVGATGPLTLDQGLQLLLGKHVRALQIRYRYEEFEWWDTIMVRRDGFQLVRIRHEP